MDLENQTPPSLGQESLSNTILSDGADAGSPSPSQTKPDWLGDEFFDAEKGVKFEELGAKFKELSEFKSAADALAAERPEKAEGYELKFPEGWESPKDFNIDEKAEAWNTLRNLAHEAGLTKAQFSKFAAAVVESEASKAKAAMDGIKANAEAIEKSFGPNGAEVIEGVKKQLPVIAQQFGAGCDKEALTKDLSLLLQWTPNAARLLSNIGKALSSGGAASFSGQGREGPDERGVPEGWEKMTFEQKWHHSQQQRSASSR